MGQLSSIEWTDHTFNPWWGCIRVSPGCEHCYAETLAKRYGHPVWGPSKTTGRRTFGEKHWREPLKWNADAEKAGVRARVFCASMADVFEDHPQLDAERAKLWPLIEATPWLDWQLLTKRPENVIRMVPERWVVDGFPPNVWMGTSAEDQQRWDDRVSYLLEIPAAVRFVSAEPLLGPIYGLPDLQHISWLIIGGESGHGARPFHLTWARMLIEQCRAGGAAAFVKQLGAHVHQTTPASRRECCRARRKVSCSMDWRPPFLADPKGGAIEEFPEDLRVREFPEPVPA